MSTNCSPSAVACSAFGGDAVLEEVVATDLAVCGGVVNGVNATITPGSWPAACNDSNEQGDATAGTPVPANWPEE